MSFQGIELETDAVGRQFEPYLRPCQVVVLHCYLECCSRTVTVVVIQVKAMVKNPGPGYIEYHTCSIMKVVQY